MAGCYYALYVYFMFTGETGTHNSMHQVSKEPRWLSPFRPQQAMAEARCVSLLVWVRLLHN